MINIAAFLLSLTDSGKTVRFYENVRFTTDPYQMALQSLEELARREVGLNVKLQQYIADRFQERQLFYSFNHPSNEVLIETVYQILRLLGLPVREADQKKLEGIGEQLDLIVLPMNRYVHSGIHAKFPNLVRYKWFGKWISKEAMIQTFFDYYSNCGRELPEIEYNFCMPEKQDVRKETV